MRSSMRTLLIALCVQSTIGFIGYNTIRSRFVKNIEIFNNEPALINTYSSIENQTKVVYDSDVSTEIYDEEINENCTQDEETNNTENENQSSEPPVIPTNMIHIEMTPEEYKEYFVAVTESRKRIWNEQYGDQ